MRTAINKFFSARGRRLLGGLACALAVAWAAYAAPPIVRTASAQPMAFTEYQIKAAFLFNFTQFIEWPTNAFVNTDAPLVIGILGDDPFGAVLDQTIEGETVHDRKVVIKRSRRVEDLRSCHLLFISRSEKGRLAQTLAALKGAPVVTVSDLEQFARQGGTIGFMPLENKLRFEINLDATESAGVKISSKLITLAVTVYSRREKERG